MRFFEGMILGTGTAPQLDLALRRSRLGVSVFSGGVQKWPSCERIFRPSNRYQIINEYYPAETAVRRCEFCIEPSGTPPRRQRRAHTEATFAKSCAAGSHQGDFCAALGHPAARWARRQPARYAQGPKMSHFAPSPAARNRRAPSGFPKSSPRLVEWSPRLP